MKAAAQGRHYSHLNSAQALLKQYDGRRPFNNYLRDFFAANKKFGSRDRKEIAALCYSFFRLGENSRNNISAEMILLARYLCSQGPVPIISALKPDWDPAHSLREKLETVPGPSQIFPFPELLSPAIDPVTFSNSHLSQPSLFLRIRPGHRSGVIAKLSAADIAFNEPMPGALELLNSTDAGPLIHLQSEAVVQDLSSQQTGNLLNGLSFNQDHQMWDCCAASGGKSIMIKDLFPAIRLTVSDIRASTLEALRERFREASISDYRAVRSDLSAQSIFNEIFDLVVADVPCSGSGTWGRTPERMHYYHAEETAKYASIQKKIVTNAFKGAKPGGYLLYITCSVFQAENEGVAAFIESFPDARKISSITLHGYLQRADSMFASLFQKIT